mmetsp:Transcript_4777/g.8338  ORF Transcript_4777/g.8338 Transcript_4777/m.8338 type:complete len:143 (-) Transcript_4777:251-679(-)
MHHTMTKFSSFAFVSSPLSSIVCPSRSPNHAVSSHFHHSSRHPFESKNDSKCILHSHNQHPHSIPPFQLNSTPLSLVILASSIAVNPSILLSDLVVGDNNLYLKIFLGGLGIIASGFLGALVISVSVGDNIEKVRYFIVNSE